MKRKTTITLTIAGLLGLAGVLYGAGTYSFFSLDIDPNGISGPIGVAASKTDVIATEYCSQNIDTIDHLGNVSVLAMIPAPVPPSCGEKYLTIAPLESASATPVPFTPRDIFVTNGILIYKVTPPTPNRHPADLCDAPRRGCAPDHTGITFDHVGTFGFNMIVTWRTAASGFSVDGTPELPRPSRATLTGRPQLKDQL